MQRWILGAALLSLIACDDDKVATIPDSSASADDGGSGSTDGGMIGGDARAGDMRVEDDRGIDPDGALADAGPDADPNADAGPDMAPETDAAPPDLIEERPVNDDAPGAELVGTATVAGLSYLAWADGAAVNTRLIGPDGAWAGEASLLAEAAEPVIGLQASAVTDVPFVAWSTGGRIRVQTADVPLAEAITLDLEGPPVLAAVGDQLLVVGRTAEGHPAWTLVPLDATNDSSFEITEGPGLPPVDSAIEVAGGIVLRLPSAGQCLFLSEDAEALSNFPCQTGAGAMVGDPSQVVLSVEMDAANLRRHTVLPLFGASRAEPFHPMNVAIGVTLPAFRADGAHPIIGTKTGRDAGNFQLGLVENDALWESSTTFPRWPLPNARAAVRQGPRAVLADFSDDAPSLVTLRLAERDFDGAPYSFEPLAGCTPTFEVCDDRDQDCDARADNGLCCEQDVTFDNVLTVDAPADQPPKVLVADVRNLDSYRILVHTEAGWDLFQLVLDEDPPQLNDQNIDPYDADLEGIAYVAAGGHYGLVANDPVDGPVVVWRHPSVPDAVRSEPHPLEGCDEVLAVGGLVHDQVGPDDPNNRPESDAGALIVCPTRFIKANSAAGTTDEHFDLPEGIRADWATITHPANVMNVAEVLVGYEQDGERQVKLFRVLALGAEPLIDQPTPSSLRDIAPADLAEPIHVSANRAKPPVQVRADGSTRVRMNGPDGWVWQHVISTANPHRSAYASGARRVVTGEQVDGSNYAFWITDTDGGNNGFDLWSTEPTLSLTASDLDGAPQLDWVVPPGVYPSNFLVVVRRVGDTWVLTVPNVRCREP